MDDQGDLRRSQTPVIGRRSEMNSAALSEASAKIPHAMKTLLLTSSQPGDANVGGVLVRDMLRCLSDAELALVSLSDSACDSRCKPLSAHLNFPPPSEHGTTDWRLAKKIASAFKRATHYESKIRSISREVQRFVEEEAPDRLWSILDSTTAIDVAWYLSGVTSIPMLVQVWDDPMHLLYQRRLDRLTRKRTMNRFHDLLGQAEKVAVIGESMQQAYAPYTRRLPCIIRHGLGGDVAPQSSPCSANEFRIGLSGGMYANSAWRVLQAALDRLGWRIDGRQVVLVVCGSHIQLDAMRPAEVRFLGWRSVEESSRVMSQCDLLYLPQAFESDKRPLTELSFPTKLSTYVHTGRPILIHTPRYGSLNAFCDQHGFGIRCNELCAEEMANVLTRLGSEPSILHDESERSAYIGSEVLTEKRFQAQVREFVAAGQSA